MGFDNLSGMKTIKIFLAHLKNYRMIDLRSATLSVDWTGSNTKEAIEEEILTIYLR